MHIDLTKKSEELKVFVSQFETAMFLGDLSSVMQFIRFDNPVSSLKGLSSPQRQLLYLAGLNVTAEIPPAKLKAQYSDEDFEHMKKLLNEIENGYEEYFYPEADDVIDEDWEMRRMIAMPTFLGYFNQGMLNYEEQIIERVIKYFSPFNEEIHKHFKLEVEDFINIYNYIDSLPNEFLNQKINKKEGHQTWEEFCDEMKEKKLMPWEWQEHLPQHFKDLFNWMYDKGKMYRYSKQQLTNNFGTEKAEAFLSIFTVKREKTNFLYYTQRNVIHSKPIFQVSEDDFQLILSHQLIQAVYNTLFEFCTTTAFRERFYSLRGKKLEDKIEAIFQRFFKGRAFVYRSFFTQDGHEQDLLFLIDGMALIVEAKASKRDEPRREPDKAYPLILSNFEETIQKGYDQAYRIKSKFLSKQPLKIYSDEQLKKHVIDIRTKNYHAAFSIIVTLERFGQIQTDLSGLLEIYDNDEFPWSVCIDDLEIFLLQLEKLGKSKSEFKSFLRLREKVQGKIITADELEVCGAFLNNRLTIKSLELQGNVLALTPDLTDIFDHTYETKGLGFENEKNLIMKTSGKYLPIGGSVKFP
jgi:hypothetical protein